MSRSTDKSLERKKPEMARAIRSSKGDLTAANVVSDRGEEEQTRPAGGDLMAQRFEIGKSYWLETSSWVYIGVCVAVGVDYIEFANCSRIPADGRHNVFMRTGTAPNMEVEKTGGPNNSMRIPIDWIGPNCEWTFDIPDTV